jgi:hypothetical protein
MSYDCQQLTADIKDLQKLKQGFDAEYRDGININTRNSLDKKEAIVSEMKKIREGLCVSEMDAEKILGEDFFGREAVREAFGIVLDDETAPSIPFGIKELRRAKELGQMLVLRVDTASDGAGLTMKKICELLGNKTKDGGKILADTEWYEEEDIYTKELPRAGWALVSREEIPNSEDRNYLEQTDIIVGYLKQVFPVKMPKKYQMAIDAYLDVRSEIIGLMNSAAFGRSTDKLKSLELTKLTRQSPVEVIYDLVLHFQNTGTRLMSYVNTWTSGQVPSSFTPAGFICVGCFDDEGIYIFRRGSSQGGNDIGLSFSRTI